jgi:hypothetical protein
MPRAARMSSAALALIIAVLVCLGAVLFSTSLLKSYGIGLFLALPFCLGLLSVTIFNAAGDKTFRACMSIAVLSVALPGVAMLFFRIEGAICLAMAMPLALLLACWGGAVAWRIQHRRRRDTTALLVLAILFPPAVSSTEYAVAPEPPLFAVSTAIDIDAPPEKVWRHVVSLSELPPPTEWIFRAGIAYPVQVSVAGSGPGALRRCEFSTGPFIEPIRIWDEPRLLQFAVTENPAPMEEWTPYGKIHPAHLDNFLVSRKGQFLLTRLAGGRTHLEGTTWYVHNLWPAGYWRLWSDFIIHRIHQRVLIHIRSLAEGREWVAGRQGFEPR